MRCALTMAGNLSHFQQRNNWNYRFCCCCFFWFFFYSLNSPPSLAAMKMTLVKIYDFIYCVSELSRAFSRFIFDVDSFYYLFLGAPCRHAHIAPSRLTAYAHVREWVEQLRYRASNAMCVLCVNFLGFIFISQFSIFVFYSVQTERDTPISILYIHRLSRHAIQILLLSSCRPHYATTIYGNCIYDSSFFTLLNMRPFVRSFVYLFHWFTCWNVLVFRTPCLCRCAMRMR